MWVGGWVGGWVDGMVGRKRRSRRLWVGGWDCGKEEEIEAGIRMTCWKLWVGRVGGWVGKLIESFALLEAIDGWVGGWVGGRFFFFTLASAVIISVFLRMYASLL